ncbi:uncharacterized protein N0V89_009053 [Didymosphaeria variabile]|uniref:PKS/mFAS DH domain-containing protein n=1 Tax=Didymosphaeria variabile TaxID=1932322 RepID=A0A9W8XIS5_9PLEO|nr:uncharacterized protein N0V89_009053 [Didymosphaeria variabile]KAJ4350432.1 hypothetical protein N0V89_009053 [Didymosphaeria variabile]
MASESVPGAESETTNGSVEPEMLQIAIMSASEKSALNRMLNLYNEQIKNEKTSLPSFIQNLAYTLNVRRTWLPYRSFLVLSNTRAIDNVAQKASSPLRAAHDPNCAFIFTGQGAQWSGMARELLQFPAFRQNIVESNTYLRDLGCTWNLLDVLVDDTYEAAISQPVLSQTLCCIIQIAMVDLYADLELLPTAVVGHSSGEIAAAGIVSDQASSRADCGMMAVSLSATDASYIIADLNESYRTPSLFLACVNSPKSVTVSGDRECMKELAIILENRNIFHRQLRVDIAYHSPYMASSAEPYAKAVMSLMPGSNKAVSPIMISSVTGNIVDHQDLQQVDYWVKNMLQPVHFLNAITRLCSPNETPQRKRLDGRHRKHVKIHVLVEIGPHAALRGPLQDTLSVQSGTNGIAYYSSLQRKHPADRTFFTTLGYMACRGFNVKLDKANGLSQTGPLKAARLRVLSDLPEYPFDHSRKHWTKGRLGNEYRFRRHHKLDLLGKPVVDWNPLEPRWQNFLKLSEMPWVGDHKIDGAVIYPAAGMMAMAMEASKQLIQKDGKHRTIKTFKLTNNQFPTALVIPATLEGIETQLVLRPTHGDSNANTASWEYRLYSCDEGKWNEHCSGKLNVEFERQYSAVDTGAEEREETKRSHELHISAEQSSKWSHTNKDFYLGLARSGYKFGPSFKVMDNVTFSDEGLPQATADVNCFQWREIDQANHYQEHIVHPTTLDGILQPTLAIASQAGEVLMPTSVPMRIDELCISATGLSFPETSTVKSRGILTHKGNVGFECDITAFDNSFSKILVRAKCVKLRFVTESVSSAQGSEHQTCYNIVWNPDLDLLSPHHPFVVPSDTALHPVSSLLALATFKRPDMDITQLSDTSNGDTHRLLRNLFPSEHAEKASLPFKRYTVLELSSIPLEDVQHIVSEFQAIEVASWDPTEVWQANRSDSEGSDLILCPWNAVIPQLIPRGLERLRIGGRVILYRTDASGSGHVDAEKIMTVLSENGFENVQAHSATNDIAIIATKSKALLPPVQPLQVVTLTESHSEYQGTLAEALRNELAMNNIPCEPKLINSVNASEITPELVYIFLSDLERPILEDLKSDVFHQLKQVLLRARKCLWLTAHNDDGSIPPGQ